MMTDLTCHKYKLKQRPNIYAPSYAKYIIDCRSAYDGRMLAKRVNVENLKLVLDSITAPCYGTIFTLLMFNMSGFTQANGHIHPMLQSFHVLCVYMDSFYDKKYIIVFSINHLGYK